MPGKSRIKRFHPALLGTLLVALIMAIWVWMQAPEYEPAAIESLANFQRADAPLMLPADGRPRHRLHRLSAWELAAMPRAERFDFPLGSAHGALSYNAQGYWAMNEARGGHHTGDDLNGIGGMNTDLGDPVRAVADGLVLYAAEPSRGWGKMVVVGHRLADGRVLQSMYAHLDRIDVAVGQAIARGDGLGTVGTANGSYPAHLHFEIREGLGVDIGVGYTRWPGSRLDPSATLLARRGAAAENLMPPVLPVALARDQPWNRLQLAPEDAARLGEILNRSE
jgi:hypothetical protein